LYQTRNLERWDQEFAENLPKWKNAVEENLDRLARKIAALTEKVNRQEREIESLREARAWDNRFND
jgi:hypothetical protein